LVIDAEFEASSLDCAGYAAANLLPGTVRLRLLAVARLEKVKEIEELLRIMTGRAGSHLRLPQVEMHRNQGRREFPQRQCN
jgi:hypothetical protein